MLASAIIDRVRKIAGDVDVLQFTNDDIVTWINDATRECASNNNLLQVSATTATVAGTTDYNLPADILRLHSVRYDGVKLDILSLSEFDKFVDEYGSTDRGTPQVVYLWANKFTLFPAPDAIKNFVVHYTRTPADIVVGNLAVAPDLPVMYHQRVVDYCLAKVAEQDDDMNRYSIKMQEFNDGVSRLRDDQESELDQYPSISVGARDSGGETYDYD